MGTLHELYQLKSKVIADGVILKVKKDKEKVFLTRYFNNKSINFNTWGIFSNTFVQNAVDGKVERIAMYSSNRMIDFKESGIYLAIQSGSKYGFGSDFITNMRDTSFYLEDALFYVIWDTIMSRFEIKNGGLIVKEKDNFEQWDYNFDAYLVSRYTAFPQIIADFYIDMIVELKSYHEEMIKEGEDPLFFYEAEEYKELLDKMNRYKKYILLAQRTYLEDWLKAQIKLAI